MSDNCPQCGEPYTIHTTAGCPRMRLSAVAYWPTFATAFPNDSTRCANCGAPCVRHEMTNPPTEGMWTQRYATPGDIAALLAEVATLREFFWLCWDSARGMAGELDGGDVQEWGEKLGLLQKVVANAPCGEGCVCADYVGDDFPTDCYRPTFTRASRLTGEPQQ